MIESTFKELETHMKEKIRTRLDLSLLEKLTNEFDKIFLNSKEGIMGKVLIFQKEEFEELFVTILLCRNKLVRAR